MTSSSDLIDLHLILTEISCTRPVVKGASTKSHKRRFYRGDRLVLRCQSGNNSFNYLKIFEKNGPGGRMVSASNWQAGRPEFESSRSQNFF